jgi:hypothetical protein
MTPATVQKLETAFLMGCTDVEASLYAGIAPSTLYLYIESNPLFSERKETLKQSPIMMAKKIQHGDLLEGNSSIAQKVIDRKEGSKQTITGEVSIKRIERAIVHPNNTDS